MKKRKNKHPIDIHVGEQMRLARIYANQRLEAENLPKITLKKIAEILDVSQQQVSKYEKGEDRITASKLYNLAVILQVSVSYFFEGYKEKDTNMTYSVSYKL